MENATLQICLSAGDIERFGVCNFGDDLLLPGVRSARRLPPGAQSVIVCLFPFYVGNVQPRNLALYAMLPDYHTIVSEMLGRASSALSASAPTFHFEPFVDASPICEVEAARRAGLGIRGQNGLLLAPDYGSMVLIGAIITDLVLSPGTPGGSCEGCRQCQKACPTGALSEWGVDAARCRSAITQKKGVLTPDETREIVRGGLVWGCDCCALACPHNINPLRTHFSAFLQDIQPLATWDNLDALLKNRAFAWRGRSVLERNLAVLQQQKCL
ncbi:MAG: DUF1730 domain-containing protein [Oscillospiraceae bacterium]